MAGKREDKLIREPLKEWFRPKWRNLLKDYLHPEYVALRISKDGFISGFDEPAMMMARKNGWWNDKYLITKTEFLAEMKPCWISSIRRMPTSEELGISDGTA